MTRYASKWRQWLTAALIALTATGMARAREDFKDGFFNCALPLSTSVEELICKNSELRTVNSYGQMTYRRIMDSLRLYPERQAIVDPAELEMGQTQWTTLAFNTCTSTQCVHDELTSQVNELIDLARQLQTGPNSSTRRPSDNNNAQTMAPSAEAPAQEQEIAALERGEEKQIERRRAVSTEPPTARPESVAAASPPPEPKSVPARNSGSVNNWEGTLMVGLLLLNMIIVFIQAHKNAVVLFSNYTDIALTLAVPAVAFSLAILLGAVGFSDIWSWSISGLVAGILTLMVAVHTYKANGSGLAFAMALIAKFTLLVASLVIALIAMAVLLGSGERRKYERHKSYEQRRRRETAATVGAGVGLFAILAHLVCRDRRFVPIDEYMSHTG